MKGDDNYDSYEESEIYEFDNSYACSSEWTEEDSWDALTDGMYGEMPDNPMMFDAMMEAMGF